MNKILITGASGMLGATLVNILNDNYDVYATGNSLFDNQHYKYLKFDLSNKSFEKLFEWSNPDIVIHCAALTNGNYCESNPEKAFEINSNSMNKILKYTKSHVKIIYISSDAVFSGNDSLSKVNDLTNPDSVYGKSKELAEKILISSVRKYVIIRTTIVGLNINKNKKGFLEWILESSKNFDKISLFDDVLFNPISIWDLSDHIKYIINNNLFSRIYHISGSEVISKYDFGIKLLNSMKLQTNTIGRGKITKFTDRAKRSNDQTLDCSEYTVETKRKLPNLNNTIKTIKKNYNEKRN
tara:strand:- start:2464 stop:3354 length:891 start_codon:yes stop_codon:yes gene_type:complete